MTRLGPLALLAFLAACSRGVRQVSPIVGPPPQPPVQPAQPVVTNNLVLSVTEAVASADEDLPSYTKVFIDGKPAGQTDAAPRSQTRTWGTSLPDGNHLFRFEQWTLPTPGEWTPVPARWQPAERFIRVELGERTLVALKFYDAERRYSLSISREPLAPATQ